MLRRPRRFLPLALLALFALEPSAGATALRPNVLLIVADDLGVDTLGAYHEGSDPPVTPAIDFLARTGLLFRNVWSSPKCSPTRAALLTGRYGLRTGVGEVVYQNTPGLPLAEVTIPELLDGGGSGYSHALIGKWHLGYSTALGGPLAPNLAGFSYFDGTLRGTLGEMPGLSYYSWPRTTNGSTIIDQTYNTTALVDSALSWIGQQTTPWFCMLSFHAPHHPLHVPPAGLHVENLVGLNPMATPRPFYKAMIEAMDAEIVRLIFGILPQLPSTMILFLGDNGTPTNVVSEPHLVGRAKNTVYEGGVNVPLIAWGPLIAQPGSECQALVDVTDLFATVTDIAGLDAHALLPGRVIDSVSLTPYFSDPHLPSFRTFAYAEIFQPLGVPGQAATSADRAIRGERYKLIVRLDPSDTGAWPPGRGALPASRPGLGPFAGYVDPQALVTELYDLQTDPFELVDLFRAGPTAPALAALATLSGQLQGLLGP